VNGAVAKYRQAYLVGLQSNLIYRWNFAARGGFELIHLAVVFILWGAVYAATPSVGGFDFRQTFTYFTTILVLQFFVGAFNEDYQISEEIRNGLINQFLLKPINYFLYRFSIFSAARSVSGVLVLAPLAAALPLIRGGLEFPHDAWRLALAPPALILAALIQFTIAYCFGLLTFWFLEIQGFVILSLAFETMLGGQIFPLDLLPAGLFRIAQLLPFYYQMYFPAAILTGRIGFPVAIRGLGIAAAWLAVLLGLAHLLWVRGLRRHTAVGG
jgi:ABC-2 type transport system permease protein